MDLEVYKNIVNQCRSLEKEVEGLKNSVIDSNNEYSVLEAEYKEKLSGVVDDRDNYVSSKIEEKIELDTRDMVTEKTILEGQLFKEKNMEPPDYTSEVSKFYLDYIDAVREYKKLLHNKKRDYRDIFKIISVDSAEDIHSDGIDALLAELSKGTGVLFNNEDGQYRAKTQGMIGKLANIVGTVKRIPQSYRLALCISLTFIALLLILVNPLIVILPMCLVSVSYMKNSIKSNDLLIKTLKSIKYYDRTVKLLENNVRNAISGSVSVKTAKYYLQRDDKTHELEETISKLSDEIKVVSEEAERIVRVESNGTEYEEKQKRSITLEYEQILDALKTGLRNIEEDLSTKEELYKDYLEQRDTGKADLEQQYFSLKKCGELKILPDKFLLGFDEYDIITLDMLNYNANLVCTTTKSDDVYVSFVNMCITQLLCTMNPSCIKIYIVDILHGTGRFGLFGSLEKQGIVKIVDTEDELRDVINYLYNLKSARDKSIRQYSDNITKYNSKLIENYGVTLDYHILISTHHIDSLIHNPLYIKLLDAGSSGIAVIGLWDKRLFEYEKDKGIESTNEVCKFLEIVSNSSDLSEEGNTNMSTMTSDGIIVPMKKQETEAKRKGILVQSNKDRK